MVMTDHGELPPVAGAPGDTAPSADVTEALAEVEEQMMVLAAYVRGAIREAATRMARHCSPSVSRSCGRCGAAAPRTPVRWPSRWTWTAA